MNRPLLLMAALLLGGCAAPEQRADDPEAARRAYCAGLAAEAASTSTRPTANEVMQRRYRDECLNP